MLETNQRESSSLFDNMSLPTLFDTLLFFIAAGLVGTAVKSKIKEASQQQSKDTLIGTFVQLVTKAWNILFEEVSLPGC